MPVASGTTGGNAYSAGSYLGRFLYEFGSSNNLSAANYFNSTAHRAPDFVPAVINQVDPNIPAEPAILAKPAPWAAVHLVSTPDSAGMSAAEKLRSYVDGILAQDNAKFWDQTWEVVTNLHKAQDVQLHELPEFAKGFAIGFFKDGLWGNIEGLADLVKFGWRAAKLKAYYDPLQRPVLEWAGYDFAQERAFEQRVVEVAKIAFKTMQAIGTKLGTEAYEHYRVLKDGTPEELEALGSQHQQVAAAFFAIAVKVSELAANMSPELKGRIYGAIAWEVAQSAAEILLTAGVSKAVTGSAKLSRFADKLADFGKYSDEFGDVAKQIAELCQDGGELRKIFSKQDEAADLARAGARVLFGHNEYVVVDAARAASVRRGLEAYYRQHAPRGATVKWVDNVPGGRNGYIDTITGDIRLSNDLLTPQYRHLAEGVLVEELQHFHQLQSRGWIGRILTAAENAVIEQEVVQRIQRSGFRISDPAQP